MRNYRAVLIIGITEILIGGITLLGTLGSLALSVNRKSVNVLFFVLVTSAASTVIGIGILKFRKLAYQLLLYFSSVILFSKVLIVMNIIQLNGALETSIPGSVKNLISIGYHGFVIYCLTRQDIKRLFHI